MTGNQQDILDGESVEEFLEKQGFWRDDSIATDDFKSITVSEDHEHAIFTRFKVNIGDTVVDETEVLIKSFDEGEINANSISGYTETYYVSGPQGDRVTLAAWRVANTGGHFHGGETSDKNAAGYISPSSLVLSGKHPQNIPVVYHHTDVNGQAAHGAYFHSDRTFKGILVTKTAANPLVAINTSTALRAKAPTASHRSPYWVAPSMSNKLTALANGYYSRTNKHITCTDASLRDGGRFDINNNWTRPHAEHRWGKQADIRNRDQNADERKIFLEEARKVGLGVLNEGNHWHVRG